MNDIHISLRLSLFKGIVLVVFSETPLIPGTLGAATIKALTTFSIPR
jgi:hypothetical protein